MAEKQESVFGDVQLGVDVLADELMWKLCKTEPLIKDGASEEEPEVREMHADGKFCICWDPLDGSSIVDNNWAVGTIIGIWGSSSGSGEDGLIGATGRDQKTSLVALYGHCASTSLPAGDAGREPALKLILKSLGKLGDRGCFVAAPALARGFAAAGLPSTMKAAVVRECGPADALAVETDYAVPALPEDGVIVANQYAGINFIDTYHRSGLYKRELPFIGGQEGGGFVAAVTPEAEAQGVKVGDRVAYSSVFQTYAEYTAVPANKCVTVPEEVPLDVAVSCGVQGMTAHYLTHSAHAGLVKPGEWMLIHGTGSGTCQWAAQMAKLRGYKVIGTCSESKQDIARATGVDELIVYKEAPGTSYEDYSCVDLVPKVMEITGGEGVKAVIDGIGLATWETSIEVLARRGIFVSFGNASGAVPANIGTAAREPVQHRDFRLLDRQAELDEF